MKNLKVCLGILILVELFVLGAGTAPLQAQSPDYLYWANIEHCMGGVGRVGLDGTTDFNECFLSYLNTMPTGVAVDDKYIYYSSAWGFTIGRTNRDGTGVVNPNFITGCLSPFGVAVDDKYIYWTNIDLPLDSRHTIGRAKLDGTDVNQTFITLSPGVSERGIAVSKEFIYLAGGSEWHPAIMRANLDGTELNEQWITSCMNAPHCVTLTSTHIYWTNYGAQSGYFGSIGRADLNGGNAEILVEVEGFHSLLGIGTKGDFIYWGEYGGNRIGRSNLDGSSANPNWITGTGFCGAIAFTPQRYTFEGFFSPIDNIPTVNQANAGQAIPVKWRLTDKNGVPVSDPASFISITSTRVGCASLEEFPINYVDEPAAGNSGLQYHGDGWWQFNWKTPKTYKGQCRTMKLTLDDHSEHTASFSFK